MRLAKLAAKARKLNIPRKVRGWNPLDHSGGRDVFFVTVGQINKILINFLIKRISNKKNEAKCNKGNFDASLREKYLVDFDIVLAGGS